jgi:hypothetical protein
VNDLEKGHEVFEWKGQGYSPLVLSHDWQVALLNWEPIFDVDRMGEIERHTQSDEVFILVKGKAILFTIGMDGMKMSEMLPGVVYNVTQGSWHNLISTRDASWVIVENRGTDLKDTETRMLTDLERSEIVKSLPTWVKV